MSLSDLDYLFRRAVSPAQFASTGQVYGTDKNGMVTSFTLTAGVDAATAVVREGGASGRIVATISALGATSRQVIYPAGLIYFGGLHLTLTGSAPTFDVVGVSDSA